jgi:phosphohistidine phosphatase
MPLKKGAACLLEFLDEVEAGQAELCWMLRPKQLRQLAG